MSALLSYQYVPTSSMYRIRRCPGGSALSSLHINSVNLPVQDLLGHAPGPSPQPSNYHLFLNFSCAGLCVDDIILLCALLHDNTQAISLSLHANDLSDLLAYQSIAQMLKTNPTLTALDLSGTCSPPINISAMEALSGALCHNHTLTSLNLRWNGLTPDSLAVLAKGLKRNTSLVSCDLSCNRIGGHHDQHHNSWVR